MNDGTTLDAAALRRSVAPRPDAVSGGLLAPTAACTVLGLVLVGHWTIGLNGALWFDEAGTAAFASSDTVSDLVGFAHGDSNAPLYYLVVWAWAKVFGVSNASLRLPSLLFSLAAPALAWAGLRRTAPGVAPVWAALLAVWGPGLVLSGYARCYALLLLAAVGTTLAFVHVLRRPTRRLATLWASCSAATVLVHYDAGFLVAAQGAALLAAHRGLSLRLWPSLLAFLPAVAWIAWHLPRLAAYARPDIAWYGLLTVRDLVPVAAYVMGLPVVLTPALLCALAAGLLLSGRAAGAPGRPPSDGALLAAALAAAAACAVVVGIGFLRPSFADRYLVAVVPGMLLPAAAAIDRLGLGRRRVAPALVLAYALLTSTAWLSPARLDLGAFEYETASAWIAERRPRRLVFLWDNPSAAAVPEAQLQAMGGAFLRRLGLDPVIDAVLPVAGGDMNPGLLAAAGMDAAVLWVYDTSVHDTAAAHHPPRLASLDPHLDCRHYGNRHFGIEACRPRPS